MAVPRLGTKEHTTLLTLVQQRLRQSENLLQGRHKRWRETEKQYRMFVDPDQIQGPVEATSDEAQLLYPYPTSVVIPMTYAIAQTLISFYVSLFTSNVPYIRVGNRNPESANPATGQELLISYQLDYIGWPMLLFQWLLDSFRYGVGIVKNSWKVDERMMTTTETQQIPLLGQMFPVQVQQKRPVLHYEGNWSDVIDPFTWRPDPQQPIAKFQEGVYCGESLYRSYFDVLKSAKQGMYDEENVKLIPRYTLDALGTSSGRGGFAQSDRDRIMQINKFFGVQPAVGDAGMVTIDPVIVDIIPQELGLGKGTDVERWLVTVANASIVVRAKEYPYQHQDFYYSIIESSPDMHSMLNPGVMELMNPLAEHISWMYNSNIENIRKTMNNQFVVDPSKIEIDDFLNPGPGRLIRLRPEYQGTPVQDAVYQMPVQDVTGRNVEMAGMLIDLLQRLSAANDQIQGQESQNRKTATEVTMATNMAAGRLRTLAKVYATQGIVPLARQYAQNNMSFMETEQYVRIAGSLENEYQAIGRAVQGGAMIRPEDIQGLFDFPLIDPSQPLDPVRWAQTWMQVSQMAMQNPVLQQAVDHIALFKQVTQSMSIADVSRFLLPQNVQVMPDQMMQQEIQKGNLVGMDGGAAMPQPPQPGQMNGGGPIQ